MTGFFEQQDRARRNTRILLILMALGVMGMGSALFAVLSMTEPMLAGRSRSMAGGGMGWDPWLLVGCIAGTALLVGLASLVRLLQLRGGGRQVAEMLGGRLVSGAPRDPLERRLLNVVEEMAIASGVPVPEVFVLDDEQGINAFAAGLGHDDAAIAVTRGCLEVLERDELQGVIAHEFSHVLNGDMRLNMHLMGIVFGIVCIGLLGRILMRSTGGLGRRGRRSSGNGIVMVGLGIFLVGLVGELCGKLIKAAVSRQREFLADASAVQFTRNPAGIAGALKKIGGLSGGSRMANVRAEEASHFFFGDIHKSLLGPGLFATHPPLAQRIRRIDPGFDGSFPAAARASRAPVAEAMAGFAALSQPLAPASDAGPVGPRVGTTSAAALQASQALLEGLPDALLEAAHSAFGASAIVYALLLSSEPDTQARQRERLDALAGRALRDESLRLLPAISRLAAGLRLPLSELCAPALRQLSRAQRVAFTRSVDALIEADQRVTLFEYLLGHGLRTRLDVNRPARPAARRASLQQLRPQVQLLLSLIAQAGALEPDAARGAFAAACERLRAGGVAMELTLAGAPQLERLGQALPVLATLRPADAALLVDACADAVLHDRRVTEHEAGLLQVVCESLGCPLPPLNAAAPGAAGA